MFKAHKGLSEALIQPHSLNYFIHSDHLRIHQFIRGSAARDGVGGGGGFFNLLRGMVCLEVGQISPVD